MRANEQEAGTPKRAALAVIRFAGSPKRCPDKLWRGVFAAGKLVEGFPFQTSGKIVSPVTITRLADGPSQQLLVSCFDGFFYVIDAVSVCAGVPHVLATDVRCRTTVAVLRDACVKSIEAGAVGVRWCCVRPPFSSHTSPGRW